MVKEEEEEEGEEEEENRNRLVNEKVRCFLPPLTPLSFIPHPLFLPYLPYPHPFTPSFLYALTHTPVLLPY